MTTITMIETAACEVATYEHACGQQWLGYWGCDAAPHGTRLRAAVDRPPGKWQIQPAYWDRQDTFELSLSASGLSEGDAWVQLTATVLTLGREAFGRVGLYWLQADRVVWFASRLQWLLPLLEQPNVNLSALYGYSCFSYVPTPLTPIEQIWALPAGTQRTWCIGQMGNARRQGENDAPLKMVSSDRTQWQEKDSQITDEATAVNQLQQLLTSAVASRIADLSKDEPVGVLLSGGLDSSLVAALLVRAGMKVRAYTLDFSEYGVSEVPYAEQVAEFLDIPLVKVAATPKQIKQAMVPAIQALDMPFGDGVCVPLYLLNQRASQDVSVIFNGEGGDQLFAGWTNKPLIAAKLYQEVHPVAKKTLVSQYMHTFHRLWGYERQVFQPETVARVQAIQPEEWIASALSEAHTPSFMHRMRQASVALKGAQNIHLRATNIGFACGLNVRSPFCDLSLARWTFGVSGELFLKGSCEKYILKRAVEGWIPPEIVWRTKRGMGVPMTAWCLGEWWSALGDWLNPGQLRAEGHLQPELAAKIAFGELSGLVQGRRIGELLWLLVSWQLWRSHVLKSPASGRSLRHPFHLSYSLWRILRRYGR